MVGTEQTKALGFNLAGGVESPFWGVDEVHDLIRTEALLMLGRQYRLPWAARRLAMNSGGGIGLVLGDRIGRFDLESRYERLLGRGHTIWCATVSELIYHRFGWKHEEGVRSRFYSIVMNWAPNGARKQVKYLWWSRYEVEMAWQKMVSNFLGQWFDKRLKKKIFQQIFQKLSCMLAMNWAFEDVNRQHHAIAEFKKPASNSWPWHYRELISSRKVFVLAK